MLFVMRLIWRPGVMLSEVIAKRAKWQYPEGINVLGEYWLPGDDVILVFETSSQADIAVLTTVWSEFFDFSLRPAVTPEEGLEVLTKMIEKTE